ncbi:MAG: TatD family hydrolase [Bacteroides sp.]|nr:TatD family hydrolase [Bacteroides sp.]
MDPVLNIHTHSDAVYSYAVIRSVSPTVFDPSCKGWFSVGIHPWYIRDNYQEELTILEQLVSFPQVLAVGEAGYDKFSAVMPELQELVFRRQIELAEKLHKPMVIHSVGGTELLLRLKKNIQPQMPWIVHGFRGKSHLARQLLNHGLYLSVGEYYNPEALRTIPLEKLFLESDESDVDIYTLCQKVAADLQIDPGTLEAYIRQNTEKLFFSG